MKRYLVQSPLLHDKERYEPGDTVEMDDDVAAPLVERGRIKSPGDGPADAQSGQSGVPADPAAEREWLELAKRENDQLRGEVERLTTQVGELNESYADALNRIESLVLELEQANAKLTETTVNDGIAETADKPAAEPPKGGSAKPKAKPKTSK